MSDIPPPAETPDWFTRARRIFYGTATALVEILQDPEKRSENLNKLSLDLNTLADELAAKGAVTEQEAFRYLEQLQHPQEAAAPEVDGANESVAGDATEVGDLPSNAAPSQDQTPEAPVETKSAGAVGATRVTPDEIADLMELTHQIESLRLDLERLRTDPNQDSSAS